MTFIFKLSKFLIWPFRLLIGISTCVFDGVKRPTGCAKRKIMNNNLDSAFSLIIKTLCYQTYKKYTEEGLWILRYDWTTKLPEIRALLELLSPTSKILRVMYGQQIWYTKFLEELCREICSSKCYDLFGLTKEPKEVEASKHINLPCSIVNASQWSCCSETCQAICILWKKYYDR